MTNTVGADSWRCVHGLLERWERQLSQALQCVLGSSTPGLSDKVVIVLLTDADIPVGEQRPGLHERATEETLGVPSVRDHLEGG